MAIPSFIHTNSFIRWIFTEHLFHAALSAITLISEQSAVRIKIVNVCVCVLGGYFELVIWEGILKDNISDKNWVLIKSQSCKEREREFMQREQLVQRLQ